jgi:hypothetical protein
VASKLLPPDWRRYAGITGRVTVPLDGGSMHHFLCAVDNEEARKQVGGDWAEGLLTSSRSWLQCCQSGKHSVAAGCVFHVTPVFPYVLLYCQLQQLLLRLCLCCCLGGNKKARKQVREVRCCSPAAVASVLLEWPTHYGDRIGNFTFCALVCSQLQQLPLRLRLCVCRCCALCAACCRCTLLVLLRLLPTWRCLTTC